MQFRHPRIRFRRSVVPMLPARSLFDRQTELLCKFEIALVMSRDAHHGPGAVFHHYVIADPDRQLSPLNGLIALSPCRCRPFRFDLVVGRIQLFGPDLLRSFRRTAGGNSANWASNDRMFGRDDDRVAP